MREGGEIVGRETVSPDPGVAVENFRCRMHRK